MAKEAYYFSHDSNARHDPKITALRSVYGLEGYGMFWSLVEMMREADGYKLSMQGKYALNAYAMQVQYDCNAIASFVHDCIHEFELFETDGSCFWSPSLLRRMKMKEEKSKKASASANARWSKSEMDANASNNDANAMRTESDGNASAMQGKESKRKESKTKKEYIPLVFLTESEHEKLTDLLGVERRDEYMVKFGSWISSKTPAMQKRRSAYMTILEWSKRDSAKTGQAKPARPEPKYGVYEMTQEELELMPRG